ncbi:hypothetical protein ASD24_29510 [Paenibacillus sp. Root52]|nr:hypothetical protein ASD24_29510 [Paenibacillus sp. Root52]
MNLFENAVEWVCPNQCEIDHVLVCGGDSEGLDTTNTYFQMALDGTYTNFFSDGTSGVPNDCFEHADGGCCTEPICPECRSDCVQP